MKQEPEEMESGDNFQHDKFLLKLLEDEKFAQIVVEKLELAGKRVKQ